MSNTTRFTSLVLLSVMVGCGGGGDAPAADEAQPTAEQTAPEVAASMNLPEGVTPAMVAEGQQIFTAEGICFTCHMEGGVGGPLAPNLTDDVWINIDGSYDAIVDLVTTGVPEPKEHPGIMLPKGGTNITDEQVRAVAAYVWTLSHGS